MRIIVFAGRGGGGVSTIAAGTACLIAAAGHRTLAFGLERGLGAAFDVELELRPKPVIDSLHGVEGHGGLSTTDEFRDWLNMLLDFRNMEAELGDDLAALPGVNIVGRLLELEMLIASETYDAVVVDAGALSQFLDLPGALDAAARWLERLFAPRQQTVFEPFLRAFAADQIAAGDEVLDTGRELLGRLANLRDLFTDPEVTSVRLVTPADHGAEGAIRAALAVLGLFSCRVDAIVTNRVLPESIESSFFDGQRKQQTASLKALRALTPGPVVVEAALQQSPPRGAKALAAFARSIWTDEIDSFLAPTDEHSVARDGTTYELRVFMPFARREDLRLEEIDEGIAVHLNGRRCVLTLPEDIVYSSAEAWSYEDRFLRVTLSG
jgi:arsenite-transporting ATPase